MKQSKGSLTLILLIAGVIGFLIGGFLWPYTINSWLVYFGKKPCIVFWQGGLIGFVPYFGLTSIPAAVMTWILLLFLI